MTKIKICGLFREVDIDYVNEARPDFAGFVIDFPKSHRNVWPDEVAKLSKRLRPSITAVGVFVDEDPAVVLRLLREGVIDIAQLHGSEDDDYIKCIKDESKKMVMKAITITDKEDVLRAEQSPADFVLLDYGKGEGKTFDWGLLEGVRRPYFLAGGITAENVREAILRWQPYAVDVSSGVETNRQKDPEKIRRMVEIVRG